MTAEEFKTLQAQMGLRNDQMAERLGVSLGTVVKLRGAQHPIPGPVAIAMRALAKGFAA